MSGSHYTLLFLILSLTFSCKKESNQDAVPALEPTADLLEIKYATGFDIAQLDDGYEVIIRDSWPGDEESDSFIFSRSTDLGISIPVERLIATSTTHITPLVLLQETEKLIGFPNTDYISSSVMRERINDDKVEDLGSNETINVERTIALNPSVVIGFGIDGNNPTYDQLEKAGIPVVFNGEWTETHPLGRAEWIKVLGVLFDKVEEAYAIFDQIEADYLAAQASVQDLEKPRVMAGATWKDIWYLPYGNSWQGTLIEDAGATYIYEDEIGSGSLAYSIETVLKDAQETDYWIAPGQYTSYDQMLADNPTYKLFKPFQELKLFTFAKRQGPTGGVIYYEEASMRPDLVLKDLIQIFHGEGSNASLYFFDPLDP